MVKFTPPRENAAGVFSNLISIGSSRWLYNNNADRTVINFLADPSSETSKTIRAWGRSQLS